MKVVLDEKAKIPTRAHLTDAGLDLYATEDKIIWSKDCASFDTGVHIEIPEGYFGDVRPKSGLCFKHKLFCFGTVDCGYTGSIRVNLFNFGETNYRVRKGDKIAQLVIVPMITPEQIKAFRIADNKTAELAEWDFEKLEKELFELSEIDFDMKQFGFDEIDDETSLEEVYEENKTNLQEKFIAPPFSIFDTRQGYWQDRKSCGNG